jgi:hypothetical protein
MTSAKTVMISSTLLDLPEHREQVKRACEIAGFEPSMMEYLPASGSDAIATSLRMVENADIYIGIFGHRYGFVPKGYDISIPEMEYNHAVELAKPRLIFFIHEDHPVRGEDLETRRGAQKLQALKNQLGRQRVASFFRSPKDLQAQVIDALTTFRKFETPNVVRSGSKERIRPPAASVIPSPPAPYIVNPHTVPQPDLIGRRTELDALTDWVARPGSEAFDARVFCLVGSGGMGKSALAWNWFNQAAPHAMKPLAGRLWWSFNESDATFERFLDRALCYVSGQSEETVRSRSWPVREAELVRYLSEEPYLLVLDGLERILIAYSEKATQLHTGDDDGGKPANSVAGTVATSAPADRDVADQRRLRQTVNPLIRNTLRKFATLAKSRILVTTRLYPDDLQLPNGDPMPGCYAYSLRGMSDEDAVALWHALGAKGSPTELLPFFHSVENHPLLVQVLAGEVARFRDAPGDFSAWQAAHPELVVNNSISTPHALSKVDLIEPPAMHLDEDETITDALSEFYKLVEYKP